MKPEDLWRFVGRKNPYAIQTDNGGYMPVWRELKLHDLMAHMNGEKTLGSYVIREDGLINYACIDIDADPKTFGTNQNEYLMLAEVVFALFPDFDRILEFSGRRGYHIWIFPEQPEPPAFLRELVKARFKRSNIPPETEVFPKQDRVDVTKKKLGNLIKLPCGKHKRGGWSTIIKEAKRNV